MQTKNIESREFLDFEPIDFQNYWQIWKRRWRPAAAIFDSTLSGAIASVGGPTNDAVLQQVEFIRLNEAGEVEQQQLDLQNLSYTIQVQHGDVLFVPKINIASFADITCRVLFPFSAVLNTFNNAQNIFN